MQQGGAGLMFDHPIDFMQSPTTYRAAATTNLFYLNNIIHDVTYATDSPSPQASSR